MRLTRKLAQVVDGIDLSRVNIGEVVELAREEADLLVAEGWAESVSAEPDVRPSAGRLPQATAADAPPRRRRPRR